MFDAPRLQGFRRRGAGRRQTQEGIHMPHAIDRASLLDLVERRRAQLVEVLPQHEYDEEHLPDSIHLPLKSLDAAAAAAALDRSRPVIVYCWDAL